MPLQIKCARVGGVEIPNQKPVEYALQYIYGIGHTTAKAILSETVRSSPSSFDRTGPELSPPGCWQLAAFQQQDSSLQYIAMIQEGSFAVCIPPRWQSTQACK